MERSDLMKLIVGLGNPGEEYEKTRHNIGFMMLDAYAKEKNIEFKKEKFNGMYAEMMIESEKVILLKPLSYMNLSGEVVRKFVDFYKIDLSDILIVHDDLDLNIGNYKLKDKGSSGGHNGLKNIELHLNSQNYKRLKIGISNPKNMDTKDYVLGKISLEEATCYQELTKTVIAILDDSLHCDFSALMSKYNRKNR